MVEYINSAAVQYRKLGEAETRVATGYSHADCYDWLTATGLHSGLRDSSIETEGFMTSLGRFVGRAEAYELAKQSGQLQYERENGLLKSQDITYQAPMEGESAN